jgi:hypothetical protein
VYVYEQNNRHIYPYSILIFILPAVRDYQQANNTVGDQQALDALLQRAQ